VTAPGSRNDALLTTSEIEQFISDGYAKIKAPPTVLAALQKQLFLARQLHYSSLEQKKQIFVGNGSGAKGYWPSGRDYDLFYKVRQMNHICHKRQYASFDFTLDIAPSGDTVTEAVLYSPNLWPDWIENFQQDCTQTIGILHGIARAALSSVLKQLNIPSKDEYFSRSPGAMRLMRYPRSDGLSPLIPAHRDYEFVTISYCDVPGLEILKGSGEPTSTGFDALGETPGELVLLAGDCLEMLSNKVVRAPIHQVKAGAERFSIVLFLCSNYGVCIEPGRIFNSPETSNNKAFSPARHLCTMNIINNPHLTDKIESGEIAYSIPKDLRNPFMQKAKLEEQGR
jgi:isopenicillin N synthase-like dioxygenase